MTDSGVTAAPDTARHAAPDVVIDLRDPPEPRLRKPDAARDEARRTGLILLLVLNGLNLLDAGLTLAVTETGLAREGNPIVGWLTLPGKIALVTALSLVLWRLKPRALIVPAVGYALVVCYTLFGVLFLS